MYLISNKNNIIVIFKNKKYITIVDIISFFYLLFIFLKYYNKMNVISFYNIKIFNIVLISSKNSLIYI